jgi:hypothetical protein|tara:strand:- start:1788 stop:2300 length:513 start_codon:yes stop_codon:yes gene_type:complete
MAKALFVTTQDIKRYSVLSGNVDPDKLIYMISIAMDTEVQLYLGTKLYDKLSDLITSGDISLPANSDYLDLLEKYVKPMTIFWAATLYVPFATYTIANGGVFKGQTENAISVDKDEVDYLANKYRDLAQFYTNNFVDYMVYNQSTFPEYNANSNDDFFPEGETSFGGWYL